LNVRFEAQAVEQVRAVHAWWKENRTSAPTLFADELRGAVRRLRDDALAERPYPSRTVYDVRRILLPRSRYHAYYVIDETLDAVVVLALWGAVRGRVPRLFRAR
jgi:hypothetical protein